MKREVIVTCMLVSILLFLSSYHQSFAQDNSVACSEEGCTPEVIEQFFPTDELWYPGKTVTRDITVTNNTDKTHFFSLQALNPYTENDLDLVFHIIVETANSTTLWSGSLYEFLRNGETIILREFLPGKTVPLRITTYMYSSSDNRYQNGVVQYNLELGISDGVLPSPSPCLEQQPLPAPQNITVVFAENSTLRLVWDELTQSHTGYEVQWRRHDEGEWHLIRLGKATDVTIGGLLPYDEMPYLVRMRGIAGCVSGTFSGDIVARFVPIPTATPPPTATPNQLQQTLRSGGSLSISTEADQRINHVLQPTLPPIVPAKATDQEHISSSPPAQLILREPQRATGNPKDGSVLGSSVAQCSCTVQYTLVQIVYILLLAWSFLWTLLLRKNGLWGLIGVLIVVAIGLMRTVFVHAGQPVCNLRCMVTEFVLIIVGGCVSYLAVWTHLLHRGKRETLSDL